MRPRHYFLMFAVLVVGLECGYKIGWQQGKRTAWKQARTWAEREARDMSADMLELSRTVADQREKSMYDKGLSACLHAAR